MTAPDLEGVQRLADAYGVPHTIDAVADKIIEVMTISETPLIITNYRERDAVIAIVGILVQQSAALDAMERGEDRSHKLLTDLTAAAARHVPIASSSRGLFAKALADRVFEEVKSAVGPEHGPTSGHPAGPPVEKEVVTPMTRLKIVFGESARPGAPIPAPAIIEADGFIVREEWCDFFLVNQENSYFRARTQSIKQIELLLTEP